MSFALSTETRGARRLWTPATWAPHTRWCTLFPWCDTRLSDDCCHNWAACTGHSSSGTFQQTFARSKTPGSRQWFLLAVLHRITPPSLWKTTRMSMLFHPAWVLLRTRLHSRAWWELRWKMRADCPPNLQANSEITFRERVASSTDMRRRRLWRVAGLRKYRVCRK